LAQSVLVPLGNCGGTIEGCVEGNEDWVLECTSSVKENILVYKRVWKAYNPGVSTFSVKVTPNRKLFPNAIDMQLIKRYE